MKFLAIFLVLVVGNNALGRHTCNHDAFMADLKRFERKESKKNRKVNNRRTRRFKKSR